jgi:hypothetical protein
VFLNLYSFEWIVNTADSEFITIKMRLRLKTPVISYSFYSILIDKKHDSITWIGAILDRDGQ